MTKCTNRQIRLPTRRLPNLGLSRQQGEHGRGGGSRDYRVCHLASGRRDGGRRNSGRHDGGRRDSGRRDSGLRDGGRPYACRDPRGSGRPPAGGRGRRGSYRIDCARGRSSNRDSCLGYGCDRCRGSGRCGREDCSRGACSCQRSAR